MKPLFIVVDGPDGSGKTTIIKHLENLFQKHNLNVVISKPLGGNAFTQAIRDKIVNNKSHVSEELEALCMAASLVDTINNIVKLNLNDGNTVILDRFTASFEAYQVFGKGTELAENLYDQLFIDDTVTVTPDIYFYCDVDIEIANKRIQLRGDSTHFDLADKLYKERVLKGYRKHFSTCDTKITKVKLDCNDILPEVLNGVSYIFNKFILPTQTTKVIDSTLSITLKVELCKTISNGDYTDFTVGISTQLTRLNDNLNLHNDDASIKIAKDIRERMGELIDWLNRLDK